MPDGMKGRIIGRVYDAKRALRARKLQGYQEACAGPLVAPRVVVAMDAGIGNAVEATPLAQAIRSLWPRAHLTLIAPFGDLFADWCVADRVVDSWDDIAGDDVDHAFLTWSTAAPDGVQGRVHAAQRLFPNYLLRPEREVNVDAVRKLGYRGDTPPLYVTMRAPERPPPDAALRFCIAACGKREHRWRNKRWGGYAELVEALLARYADAQICILGGTDDDFPGTPPASGRVLDLRNRLTLAQTAWLLRRTDLAIGNDSGPMHIADAVLAPSLVIFGPTCEIKNGPRNRGVPLRFPVECSPCQYDLELLDRCEEPRCMTGLGTAMVLERVIAMLADTYA